MLQFLSSSLHRLYHAFLQHCCCSLGLTNAPGWGELWCSNWLQLMHGDTEQESSQGCVLFRDGGSKMIPSCKYMLRIIFETVWPFPSQVDQHNRNLLGLNRGFGLHYCPARLDQFSSQTGIWLYFELLYRQGKADFSVCAIGIYVIFIFFFKVITGDTTEKKMQKR